MELLTKYPVLVDPTKEQKDNFRFTANTKGLPGDLQTVESQGFVIKGNRPVFEGEREISQNDFIYLDEIKDNNKVLTPMDEWLYSERNISEGELGFGEFENWGDVFSNLTAEERQARKQERKISREAARKVAREKANQTTPGNGEPPAAEQDAKAKEGKFWNVLKGGWDSFSKSSSGQILLDTATNYLSNKLGANTAAQGGGGAVDDTPPPPPAPEPMSKTTKIALIGGGVLLVGIILYSVLRKK
jgi:hypothetical protein